jgi:hypothetical protein
MTCKLAKDTAAPVEAVPLSDGITGTTGATLGVELAAALSPPPPPPQALSSPSITSEKPRKRKDEKNCGANSWRANNLAMNNLAKPMALRNIKANIGTKTGMDMGLGMDIGVFLSLYSKRCVRQTHYACFNTRDFTLIKVKKMIRN